MKKLCWHNVFILIAEWKGKITRRTTVISFSWMYSVIEESVNMGNLTDQGNNLYTNNSRCARLRLWFGNKDFGVFLLALFYSVISEIIVVSNGLLLYKLLKKKQKTRVDKLFIILSASDICVGSISLPVSSLPLIITDIETLCKISPCLTFFLYFPYLFSWTMVIIISVDRVLMITKRYIYGKFVTMKVLYSVMIFLLLKDILSAIFMSFYINVLDFSTKFIQYSQLFVESFFISVTVISYLYLLYYVRSRSRKIGAFKHTANQNEKRLTKTVIVIFMFLVIFTIPHFVGVILAFYFDVSNAATMRNIVYWSAIALYSNSAANAIILLINFQGPNQKQTSGFVLNNRNS